MQIDTALIDGGPKTKSVEVNIDGFPSFHMEGLEQVRVADDLVLEKSDSMYVYHGDMLLTPEQIELLKAPVQRGGSVKIRLNIGGTEPFIINSLRINFLI